MSMTINIAPVVEALSRIAVANHGTWLAATGDHFRDEIQRRIRSTKTAPDGKAWAPWKDSTERKRTRKGNADQGLLWDTGNLLESQTFASDLGGHLEIGTNVEYAHFLQGNEGQEFSTKHMVARPFVGWSTADEAYLETSLIAHLQALIG